MKSCTESQNRNKETQSKYDSRFWKPNRTEHEERLKMRLNLLLGWKSFALNWNKLGERAKGEMRNRWRQRSLWIITNCFWPVGWIKGSRGGGKGGSRGVCIFTPACPPKCKSVRTNPSMKNFPFSICAPNLSRVSFRYVAVLVFRIKAYTKRLTILPHLSLLLLFLIADAYRSSHQKGKHTSIIKKLWQ